VEILNKAAKFFIERAQMFSVQSSERLQKATGLQPISNKNS